MLFSLLVLLLIEAVRRYRNTKVNKQPPPQISRSDDEKQRRAWARIEASQVCRFQVIGPDYSPPKRNGILLEPEMERGLIVDLSGGGCKIATSRELRIGDKLQMTLELEPKRKLTIKGQVVRTEKKSDDDQSFFAGVQFQDMREAVRDQIITWMFKHQQEILEGQRRLAEGLCLRCGKPLSEGMRQQTIFCSKCSRMKNEGYWRANENR